MGKRNLALGFTAAGTGIANIFLSPLVTASIKNYGLSNTFLWEGALILVVGIGTVILLRNNPNELGLCQYMEGANGSGEETKSVAKEKGNNTVSGFRWYLVLFSCFLFAAPSSAGFLNVPVLFDSFGYDKTVIGWLISYLGLTMIIGKILMGRVYDRIGGFKANFIVCICSMVGMFILSACLGTGSVLFPILAITALGIGQILSTITQPVWARDLRGDAGFSKGVSQLTFSFMLGSLVHNWLFSLIEEKRKDTCLLITCAFCL